MSSFTDEHIDELKARRQRRQGRQAPPPANGATPSGAQSAGAARDLLRGLITNDGQHSEPLTSEAPATTHAGIGDEPHTRAHEQDADSDSRMAGVEAQARNDGEKIDELIRRVKEGALGSGPDASSTIQQRRPKGTAHLSPDAAPRRRAARPRVPGTDKPPHSGAGAKRNTRRWAAAAVLIAGTAVLLITLGSVGGNHAPGAVSSSAPTARLPQARPGVFGEALRTTIAVIDRQLQAVARRAAEAAQAVRTRRTAKRRRARSHASVKRSTHQTPPARSRPVVESSPPVTRALQTPTHAPAAAPARSTSQTSTPQTPATGSSRPAGPSGSDPLGGIGSCVKGC